MAPKMKKTARQFWDKNLQREFENDSHHPLIRSTGYNYLSLELEGFGDMVGLLEYQGWNYFSSESFFRDSIGIDSESVRLFYTNLRKSETLITSLVHGVEISFSIDDIQNFISSLSSWKNIGRDRDGIALGYSKENSTVENIDVSSLLNPSYQGIAKPTASHLTRDNRLLTHILFHTIIPHEGSMTSLNSLTLSVLHCINNKILINLPYLVVSHMFHSRSMSKSHYPYGHFITMFLHKKFKIPLSNKLDFSYQVYDKKNLFNIFTRDETSKSWIFSPKSNSNKRPRIDSIDTPTSTSRPLFSTPSTSIPESDPSMDTSQNSSHHLFIDNLSKQLMSKFDDKMNALETLIKEQHEELYDRISMCELQVKNHIENTHARMDKVFEMFEGFGNVLKYTKKSVDNISKMPKTDWF